MRQLSHHVDTTFLSCGSRGSTRESHPFKLSHFMALVLLIVLCIVGSHDFTSLHAAWPGIRKKFIFFLFF